MLSFSVTKCQDEIQNGAGDVRDGWFLTHNTKDRVIEHASAHSFIAWITTVSEVACQLRRKQERKCPDRYTVSGSITTLEYKACASPETHYCCSRSKKKHSSDDSFCSKPTKRSPVAAKQADRSDSTCQSWERKSEGLPHLKVTQDWIKSSCYIRSFGFNYLKRIAVFKSGNSLRYTALFSLLYYISF